VQNRETVEGREDSEEKEDSKKGQVEGAL